MKKIRKIVKIVKFLFYFVKIFFTKLINSFFLIKVLTNKKFSKKLIVCVQCSEFGSMVASTKFILDLLNEKKIQISNVIFLFPKKIINNQFFFFLKKNFKVLKHEKIFNIFFYSFNLFQDKIIRYKLTNGYVNLERSTYQFIFSNKQIDMVQEIFYKLNINPKQKIVCLSNRDNFFYDTVEKKHKDFNNYRNSHFSKFGKSINFLINSNYTPIRVGHYDNEKGYNQIRGTMDLTKKEKEIFDLYLNTTCEFAVVPSSGLAWVPHLFDKPTLMHNLIPYGESPSVNNGIMIPKLIKSIVSNEIINIKNLLNMWSIKLQEPNLNDARPFFCTSADKLQSDHDYKKFSLYTEENSEEEIFMAMKEIIHYVIKKQKLSKENKDLQIRFKLAFPFHHPLRNTKALISPFWLKKYFKFLI